MTMRLSLALALQGNPDILLLDDVLSVGDLAFQQQCVERMLELKAAGCTMVLALRDESPGAPARNTHRHAWGRHNRQRRTAQPVVPWSAWLRNGRCILARVN